MEILIEIDFDSGTRRYSRLGIRTPDAFYHAGVTGFGGISREISLVPDQYRASSVSVTFSNVSGEFTQLRTNEPWRNRPFRILVVNPDEGIGSLYTAFEGRIETWDLTKDVCTIQAVDWIQARLRRPLLGVIGSEFYTNLPDETPRALIPIVIGEVSSPGGAVPAYLVDPDVGVTGYRYVMAQGRIPEPDAVYAFGSLVNSNDYTINYDDGPGGIECTYIDFDSDQRTGGDGSEPHVAWNGSGITDDQTETGNAVTNGAHQLATLLRLQGFSNNDLDLNTIIAAADALDDLSIEGAFVAVDNTLTVGEAVTQFAESYNLQIFATRTGKVGFAAPSTSVDDPDVPEVTALRDVVRDSFSARGTTEVAATLVAPYKRNYLTGDLESQHMETSLRQVNDLGEDVVLRREFPFIRDANSIAAVVTVRMFFLRERRQLVRSHVPPRWYEDLDIGRTIKLTHFAGIGPSGEIEEENHRTEDLVALYRMDEGEGQTLGDSSGNANDGELGSTSGSDANDPDWVAEGLDFDGSDDYATAPFLVDPDASDFTAFVIFRASQAGHRRVLLYQEDGSGTGRVWLEIDTDNKLATHIGGDVNVHSETLEAGEWYAATVRKFGTTISLFLEGGDKEDFTETAEASDGDMMIGWDGTAEIPEVPDIFQGIITDDLRAWYRFDEGSGDTLTDYAGNSLDGQLGSSAGADANDPDWTHEGLNFPTTGDRVVCPSPLNPSSTDFTVFAAFKPDSTVAQRVICAQGITWMYLETTNNRLSSVIGSVVSTNTTNLTAGQWYIGCVRKVGTTISIFVDGANKQDFTRTAGSSTASLFIGSHPSATLPFHDEIALLAIYDDGLTDQEVADNSAAMADIVAGRIAEDPIPPAEPAIPAPHFDDRMALIAAYDDAISDTAVASNTLALKEIVNRKVSPAGFYRVLGSKLVSVSRSLAAELTLVDLTQEPLLTLLTPQQPTSFALIDGSSSVQAAAKMAMTAQSAIAGSSIVTANARQNFITDGLQHLWPFLDGSGTTLTDVVGSAHGTLGGQGGGASNRPTWVTEGLEFDGSNDWVTIPTFQDASSGSWTVVIVFRSDANTKTIMSQVGGLNRADWLAHTSSNSFSSGLPDPALNAATITTGQWYVGFVRRNLSTNELRLNLVRTGSNQTSAVTDTVAGIADGFHVLGFSSFEFPSSEFGFPFDGKKALMMHYNRRISDAEVTTTFNGIKSAVAGRGISL